MKPANQLRVVLTTPTGVLLDTDVREIEAEDRAGRFTVQAQDEPVLTALQPGEVVLRKCDGRELRAVVTWGSLTKLGSEARLVVEGAQVVEVERLRMAG